MMHTPKHQPFEYDQQPWYEVCGSSWREVFPVSFNFVSSPTFNRWDWRNPLAEGIGGSETSHVEMSERLARRGHSVLSWSPVPDDVSPSPAGVPWLPCGDTRACESVDWSRSGIWVIYREPKLVTSPPPHCPVWLISQDIDYPDWTDELLDRVDRIVCLCQEHRRFVSKYHPRHAHKVCVSSNGIRPELVREVLSDPPPRNPKRFMYASSPDRGLWYLLAAYERLQELVSDTELHVCYGFDNIDKVIARFEEQGIKDHWLKRKKQEVLSFMDRLGVVWQGRIPQRQLLIEWAKSGIWCHPSTFPETSGITCMEAQAMGAIPITAPVWGFADNVRYGVFIDGVPQEDSLVWARYVKEMAEMARDPDRQEAIRGEMMPWALNYFSWERFVDQWEDWAAEDLSRKAAATSVERIEEVTA